MFVIDFLKTMDKNKVIESLFQTPYFFEELCWDRRFSKEQKQKILQKIKEKYLEEYDNIISTPKEDIIFNNRKILMIHERLEFIDNKDYIKTISPIFPDISDIHEMNYDCGVLKIGEYYFYKENLEFEEFEDIYRFRNPLTSICFSPREETLGMKIAPSSIEKFGELIVAKSIIKDLTSFSIIKEERMLKIKEIEQDLAKIDDSTENTEIFDLEELRERLGGEHPSEQKKDDNKREFFIHLCEIDKKVVNLIFDIRKVLRDENILE